MGLRELKRGFWIEGFKAESNYLVRERFTGEVTYWFDNSELRRTVKFICTGKDSTSQPDPGDRTVPFTRFAKFVPRIDEWCEESEGPLKFFFDGGEIRRLEI